MAKSIKNNRKTKNRLAGQIKARESIFEYVGSGMFLAFMALHPIYLNNRKYYDLTWHKTSFFYLLTVVSVVAFAAAWCATHNVRPSLFENHKRRRFSIVDWAVCAFLASNIISAIFSPFVSETVQHSYTSELKNVVLFGLGERFDGVVSQICYVAVYFLISRTYKYKKYQYHIFSIISIAIALIGILQFFDMDIFELFPYDWVSRDGTRPYAGMPGHMTGFRSTLGNVDIVSTYASVAAIINAALYALQGKVKSRFLYLGGAVMSVLLLLTGGARSGIVGLALGLALLFMFALRSKESFLRYILTIATVGAAAMFCIPHKQAAAEQPYFFYRKLPTEQIFSVKVFIVFLACMLAIVLLDIFLVDKKFLSWAENRKRDLIITCSCVAALLIGGAVGVNVLGADHTEGTLYELREMLHGNFDDDFATHRIYIWRSALEVVPENLILGTGPDTFGYALTEDMQTTAWNQYGETYDKAHNEYVQVLVCLGIVGLAVYLVVMFGLLVKGIGRHFSKRYEFNLPIAVLLTGILTYAAQAFFNINLPITAPLLWTMLGATAALLNDQIAVTAETNDAVSSATSARKA